MINGGKTIERHDAFRCAEWYAGDNVSQLPFRTIELFGFPYLWRHFSADCSNPDKIIIAHVRSLGLLWLIDRRMRQRPRVIDDSAQFAKINPPAALKASDVAVSGFFAGIT